MTDDKRVEPNVNVALKDFLGNSNKVAQQVPTNIQHPRQVAAAPTDDGMEDASDDDYLEDLPTMDKDFKPIVSDESLQEKKDKFGIKPKLGEVDGKILTILSAEFGMPKRKELINGTLQVVAPKQTTSKKGEFYETKLRVRFVENNYLELVPSAKYWVNDGIINPKVSIDMNGNSKVTQLFRMVIVKLAKAEGKTFELIQTTINEKIAIVPHPNCYDDFKAFESKISDKKILDYLVGKRVLMKDSTGTYNGRPWNRADIVAILDD